MIAKYPTSGMGFAHAAKSAADAASDVAGNASGAPGSYFPPPMLH